MDSIFWLCALCAAASFLGAFIQRVSGFGFGIVVMMIFPLMISHGEATTLSGLISLLASAFVAYSMRRHIRWKLVLICLVAYTVTNALAVAFVQSADTELLRRLLGGALLLLSLYFLFFSKKINLRPTPVNGCIAGGLSGIMGGMFSMGGPPMVVYYLSACDSGDQYLATIQAFFALANVISTATRLAGGMITARVCWLLPGSIAAMLLANALGKRVYGTLSPQRLKAVVYGFMAISGLLNLIL